jgi:hypothetical protein
LVHGGAEGCQQQSVTAGIQLDSPPQGTAQQGEVTHGVHELVPYRLIAEARAAGIDDSSAVEDQHVGHSGAPGKARPAQHLGLVQKAERPGRGESAQELVAVGEVNPSDLVANAGVVEVEAAPDQTSGRGEEVT